jgi:DNA mismatch repair protein MutL
VIDNGKGMNVTDARLCFERHATSKIRKAEDLFQLHTKGFRGEALASIAAIAHVELKTKQDQEQLGTQIIIEGSKLVSQDVVVTPRGTSFSVKNLFFNIPARRNFLKSEVIEFRHIMDEFQRVALAHPSIHFTFYHNGNEVFVLPISNLRQRIVALFAGKTNEKLVPTSEETDILKIEGFVGKPEFAKKNRGEQFFFVNDRYIKSGYLHHAVMNAYEGILREGTQPSYFLYLTVPTNTIDINIHPTKTEIKFDDEQALYAILRATIKHSLGQFNVAPILDFDRDANLDTPYHYKNSAGSSPTIHVDENYNPFSTEMSPKKNEKITTHYQRKSESAAWEGLYVGLKDDTDSLVDIGGMHFEQDEVKSSLFDGEEVEKDIKKTYQIQKKYIVNPIKSGMIIVDQQRAHQRILYEQFLTNMTVEQGASQQLLFPLHLYFSKNEIHLIEELQLSLTNTGFQFDANLDDHIVITGLPTHVSDSQVNLIFEQLLEDLYDGTPSNSFSQNDTIAKSMAKSLAVKSGMYLTEKEQENIVNGLFACKEPHVSPFQKPTFITMSVEDLDKKFAL